MTSFGYGLLSAVIVSLLLAIGIVRRSAGAGEKSGIWSILFAWLVLSILSVFVIVFGGILTSKIVGFASFPRYEANVISVESYWTERTYEDSDGDTYTRDVLMHRPTYRFTDNTGTVIDLPSDVASGHKPAVGSTATVGYHDGELIEISLGNALLYVGFTVMIGVMGYLVLYAFVYALGFGTAAMNALGLGGLFYVIIPGAMLFMFFGLSYGIYDGLFGDGELSGIFLIIVAVMNFGLALGFLGYLKMLWGRSVSTEPTR